MSKEIILNKESSFTVDTLGTKAKLIQMSCPLEHPCMNV